MCFSRFAAFIFFSLLPTAALAEDAPTFVGAEACAGCHAEQMQSWISSHHAQAMQKATPANVLGDFVNATLTHHGVTTTFRRDGDSVFVQTEGPDGKLHDYKIAYTFGVYPLQQYLIAFPGGRYQALGIAWDSRTRERGGQRWVYLYPGETLVAGDRLDWTGRDQTWNYQCASCHSTNLKKNYDLRADAYATSWSEINVSCEACHGPGSRHLAWAQSGAKTDPTEVREKETKGLTTWLPTSAPRLWHMNPKTGIAQLGVQRSAQEIDVCAPCHSRRKVIAEDPTAGAAFLDSYLPALLEPNLYHADGQIDGEVYEYGSFVQSRMYHAGVICSDCHEPHGLKLRAQDNALCGQCHLPAKFDTAAHHHHEPGSEGAQCVNCHMPRKTYMIVDERRDHSLRVPRPDLTLTIGTPNACTACHSDKPADWAAHAVANWFPDGRHTKWHYGMALSAARSGAVDAEHQLDRLIADTSQPAIARATALAFLPQYASPRSEEAVKAALIDIDPLVRAAAPRALAALPSATTIRSFATLLGDPVRAVRIEAARALAGIDQRLLTAQQKTAFAAAYLELFVAEMVDADRPEAHLNLGLLETRLQRGPEAEAHYRTALRLDPNFVPGLVNLADLDRQRGADDEGAELLRKATELEPNNADARHAMGLFLIRQKNYAEALVELRRANELAPDNARYAYVYAVALNSTGDKNGALKLIEQTHQRHPANRDALLALVSIATETGDLATALRHARELSALFLADVQIELLMRDLERRQPH
jgi:tetratricopeptide (TPR) repeat protein